MAFVLDCSVALAWVLPDEANEAALALLNRLVGESAIVPELWPLEVTNVLLMSQQRKRLAPEETEEALECLLALPIEIDRETHEHAMRATFKLARTHNLTNYDAAYLELAIRKGIPLATLDKKLRKAGREAGVKAL